MPVKPSTPEETFFAQTLPHIEGGHHFTHVQWNHRRAGKPSIIAHSFEFLQHVVCVFPKLFYALRFISHDLESG